MKNLLFLVILFFFCCIIAVSESVTVQFLPAYPGILPFKLETGYISVEEDVELFYYFIESERNPVKDPVILWLNGGPGCSGFSSLVYQIGPLMYSHEVIEGQLPSFVLNPYSWTKVASIIFLDSPAGTGYAYRPYSEDYHTSDTKTVQGNYVFLQKWLLNHPNFINNQLFIAGDSYAGLWVPMVAWKISQGNEAGDNPHMNLEGYMVGNPKTDDYIDENSHLPFANRIGLLSDYYYEAAKINCGNNYVDSRNSLCDHSLQTYKECVQNIYVFHVLEPTCRGSLVGQGGVNEELGFSGSFSEDDESMEKMMNIRLPSPLKQDPLCAREKSYSYCEVWANDPNVQKALHVREGTIDNWKRCHKPEDIKFEIDAPSVIEYHQLLTTKGYRVLVYSGDHDFAIPYTATMEWIHKLNLTMVEYWKPWSVQDEVAGYTEKYISPKNQEYNLTFATVKGGGHTAPEYKPKECLAMFDRFLSNNPL